MTKFAYCNNSINRHENDNNKNIHSGREKQDIMLSSVSEKHPRGNEQRLGTNPALYNNIDEINTGNNDDCNYRSFENNSVTKINVRKQHLDDEDGIQKKSSMILSNRLFMNNNSTRSVAVFVILSFVIISFFVSVIECIRILPQQQRNRVNQESENYYNNNNNQQSIYNNSTIPFTIMQQQQRRRLQQEQHTQYNTRKDGTSFTVDIPTSPDEHLVTDLPLLDPSEFTTRHWAGHLPANDVIGDKYLFYWLFEPDITSSLANERRQKNKNSVPITDPLDTQIPLLVWLNGGPACSSMDGLWLENGPFRIVIDESTNEYKIIADTYSWHKLPAYTLYIDQPVGTGLSITSSFQYPTNDNEVNIDLYYFFQQFFQLHSDKFVSSNDNTINRGMYFSGESYAGHYIPSFINFVAKKNEQRDNDDTSSIKIIISGAAIGNGWTDPYYQYAAAEFALGHSLIDMEQFNFLKREEATCQNELNTGNYNIDTCFELVDNIVNNAHGSNAKYKLLSYDIRQSTLSDEARQFPFGHKVLESYLGGHKLNTKYDKGSMTSNYLDVLKSIHAIAMDQTSYTFTECTDPPYNALSGNDGLGVVDDVVDILHSESVRLLFFNGVYDIVCNHIGNELFLNNMKSWSGVTDFRTAERYAWYSYETATSNDSNSISGFMKQYKNLQFLKINNAGHMVPVDVPEVAYDMMYNFINYDTFQESIGQQLQMLTLADHDEQASCPICPTCISRDSGGGTSSIDSGNQNNTKESTEELGAFIISYAWIVAGVALFSFFAVVVVVSKQRRNSSNRRGDHIPISSIEHHVNGTGSINYNIELRKQSTTATTRGTSSPYRDDDNDNNNLYDTNNTNNHNGDDDDTIPYIYPPNSRSNTPTNRRFELS